MEAMRGTALNLAHMLTPGLIHLWCRLASNWMVLPGTDRASIRRSLLQEGPFMEAVRRTAFNLFQICSTVSLPEALDFEDRAVQLHLASVQCLRRKSGETTRV